ncbi:hypothetical protein TRAPUB_2209 [Trametes pubescens]|uniref:Protein kinase domain-containing protein n=1 Tax=Trametes pubescens TaxID=154538 RepID=A0A1M2VHB3_TRAPU|nr:hypothetical protein TRAPUB_2209 [Trametes pubescens]
MDAPEIPGDLLQQPAYMPMDKWRWTQNKPLSDAVTLRSISGTLPYALRAESRDEFLLAVVDATCATSIMRGKIDGTEVTYLCKSWSRASRDLWRGFYSELKLFSSPHYMRGMQGFIVPNIINLYESPSSISLLMELPHTSFWMEASADMPDVLKKVVYHHYIALHQRGILHGEPELRNMLIGGDGHVTLINFHAARARDSIPELGLEQANQRDFALELRQVAYKLDYDGARARENAKMARFLALEKRNKRLRERGRPADKPLLEEREEPFVPLDVWRKRWTNAPDAAPRRHVVPGQAPDELQRCIHSFEAVIEHMDHIETTEMVSPIIVRMPPSAPSSSGAGPSSPSAPSSSRKRKAGRAIEDAESPHKRARGDEGSDEPPPPPPSYERSSTTYDTGTSQILLRAQPTQKFPPKADFVRDFVDKPYNGPRGYYVPDPPTEARMSAMRIVHIRNTNAIQAGLQGLHYYRLDLPQVHGPAFKRSVPAGCHISLGALKRRRAAAEHPDTTEGMRAAKRVRFEQDRVAALMERRKVQFKEEVSFLEPPPQVPDYGRAIVDAPPGGWLREPAPAAVDEPPAAWLPEPVPAVVDEPPVAWLPEPAPAAEVRILRSILKSTPPVKGMTYDFSLWPTRSHGAADELDEAGSELSVRGSPPNAAAGPSASPLSDPDAPEGSGRILPFTGVAAERAAGSATERYDDASIADGSDGAASLSGPPSVPSLARTDEAFAAPAPWTVPFAERPGASMVRGTDASGVAGKWYRTQPWPRGGAGSPAGRVPLPEDSEEEETSEVEVILFKLSDSDE